MYTSIFLEYTIARIHKKICVFSGLCPMRLCVSDNISRACSRIFPATHSRACLVAGGKATNTKSPPLAVKKSLATPVQKRITLLSIGSRHIDGIHKLLFFLPPTAVFFYGHWPLFEPWRLLSSCKAWRWGWWRRQGGKLVFRLASPPSPKWRSRQQPPWLFVFISSTSRSS